MRGIWRVVPMCGASFKQNMYSNHMVPPLTKRNINDYFSDFVTSEGGSKLSMGVDRVHTN